MGEANAGGVPAPTAQDVRRAHLELYFGMRSLWALGEALAALGLEVTHGEQRIKDVERETRERETELKNAGPSDDPPDDELPPWVNFDIFCETENDLREAMLGAAFVLCQAGLTRIISRTSRFYGALEVVLDLPKGHFARGKALLDRGERVEGLDYSRARLIHELANYFKHVDQWTPETWDNPSWREEDAVAAAKAVGLTSATRHTPLTYASEALGIELGADVPRLADDVQAWAELIVAEAQQAMAPLPSEPEPDF